MCHRVGLLSSEWVIQWVYHLVGVTLNGCVHLMGVDVVLLSVTHPVGFISIIAVVVSII